MTVERWKQTYDFMVAAGLLDPKTDWKKGFDLRFVKDLKIGVQ
jgi:NitT/TauT family transport system substrate-binding protein